ncbi:MAG: hypothetical protein FWE16_03815 [Firmicutes bacterium]|nr:hypothetical protein [Bacillota bacterium]
MFKLVWEKKFLILFLVLLIAILPVALTSQPLVLEKGLVTAIGINKVGDEYQVTCEIFIFAFDPLGAPERKPVTTTAPTVEQAITKIGHNNGRDISFSHCTVIILGSGLDGENIDELLYSFFNDPRLNNSCIVIYTQSDIPTLFETSNAQGDPRSAKLQQIIEYNNRNKKFTSTNLEQFFKDIRRNNKTKVAIINEQDGELLNTGLYKEIVI